MTDEPSSKDKDQQQAPSPEVLKPQADETEAVADKADGTATASGSAADTQTPVRTRRPTYRPGHKGTFIGLAVVVLILGANAAVIAFVIKKQTKQNTETTQGQVTINQGVLDKLGVNRSSVGDSGVELTINPDAKFNGKLQVSGDLTVAGKLSLNGAFSAPSATFAKLQGGETALASLNVNGNSTVSNLNVRNELDVTGVSRLQGPVTISQLLTVNNLNVAANLSVGGVLTAPSFHTGTLAVDSVLTIGGHIVTQGLAPSAVAGNALGSNGTISISGSDAAGTVAANIGVGAGSGTIATITFRTPYSNTPHVVVTPVGAAFGSVYVNRSARGFSIVVSGAVSPGGYAFDYIVVQ